MSITTKKDRPAVVKARRTDHAETGFRSSSDPIAFHDSANAQDDLGLEGMLKDSSSDALNIGHTTRRRERSNMMRVPGSRLQPYSPPGFFAGIDPRNKSTYVLQDEGMGVIGKRREPAAIPRLSSEIREESYLVRDKSLDLSSADDESSTASQTSRGYARQTIRAHHRQIQHRSRDDEKASSFDHLQLQHPFSEKSWRNSGFEVGAAPGLTYRDSSEDSSAGGSDGGVGYGVTQSWKPGAKRLVDCSSLGDGDSESGSEESDSDDTDSETTIDSFSLEFPRAALPDHQIASGRTFASPIDSLSEYDFARHALPEPGDRLMHNLSSQTRDHAGTASDRQEESTPLTEYAVTQTADRSFGPSRTFRTDALETVQLANPVSRKGKQTINQASSRIAAISTPLTAFQATQNSTSSYKSATLRPSMMLSSKNKTSSRPAGSSTPLTAFQVTQNPSSSHVMTTAGLATSTPLSNYAADSTIDPSRRSGKDGRAEGSAVQRKSDLAGVTPQNPGPWAMADDPSIEYGRERLASMEDCSLGSMLNSTIGRGLSKGLEDSVGSRRPIADESEPLGCEKSLDAIQSVGHNGEDMQDMQNEVAPLPFIRKRARQPAERSRDKRQKTKQTGHVDDGEAVSYFFLLLSTSL
jgi:hypothetical protein